MPGDVRGGGGFHSMKMAWPYLLRIAIAADNSLSSTAAAAAVSVPCSTYNLPMVHGLLLPLCLSCSVAWPNRIVAAARNCCFFHTGPPQLLQLLLVP